jgi:hypothetical protein
LHKACTDGNVGLVKVLVEAGANPELKWVSNIRSFQLIGLSLPMQVLYLNVENDQFDLIKWLKSLWLLAAHKSLWERVRAAFMAM